MQAAAPARQAPQTPPSYREPRCSRRCSRRCRILCQGAGGRASLSGLRLLAPQERMLGQRTGSVAAAALNRRWSCRACWRGPHPATWLLGPAVRMVEVVEAGPAARSCRSRARVPQVTALMWWQLVTSGWAAARGAGLCEGLLRAGEVVSWGAAAADGEGKVGQQQRSSVAAVLHRCCNSGAQHGNYLFALGEVGTMMQQWL